MVNDIFYNYKLLTELQCQERIHVKMSVLTNKEYSTKFNHVMITPFFKCSEWFQY